MSHFCNSCIKLCILSYTLLVVLQETRADTMSYTNAVHNNYCMIRVGKKQQLINDLNYVCQMHNYYVMLKL